MRALGASSFFCRGVNLFFSAPNFLIFSRSFRDGSAAARVDSNFKISLRASGALEVEFVLLLRMMDLGALDVHLPSSTQAASSSGRADNPPLPVPPRFDGLMMANRCRRHTKGRRRWRIVNTAGDGVLSAWPSSWLMDQGRCVQGPKPMAGCDRCGGRSHPRIAADGTWGRADGVLSARTRPRLQRIAACCCWESIQP